jgi:TolB protein
VQPSVTPTGLHVAVHDVAKKQVLQVADFPLPTSYPGRDWRMAVHAASDEVLRWITGVRGSAATRIAFVRGGQLVVVDSDGAMETTIPTVGAPMSPAWHPQGDLLAYNTYGRGSRVVLHDFRTGRARTASGTAGGVNQTPVFSPDGRSLVYSHTPAEGGDLYLAALDGEPNVRKITVGRGVINVSPSYSPDGRRIAFTSSRAGHPEVYIMDADGTNPELLSPYVFGEESYQSNPDFSPDGRFVAFQAMMSGRFQLKLINLRDRSVRQLTSEGRNEDPSWAPDGRHIVFTSDRSGTRQLWVLDVETNVARQLTFGSGGARLAAWSPRLLVAR